LENFVLAGDPNMGVPKDAFFDVLSMKILFGFASFDKFRFAGKSTFTHRLENNC